VTIVGIPMAIFIVLFYLVACYLSIIVAGAVLGKVLSHKFGWEKEYWSFLLGYLLVILLIMVPFLGFFAKIAFLSLGMGGLVQLVQWKK